MKLSPSYGLYEQLLKCRIVYLYLFTTLFSIMSIGVWWYFFYAPVLHRNDFLQNKIDDLHVKRARFALAERTINGICQSIDVKAKIDAKKSKTFYAQQTLSTIAHCAHTAGLSVGSCRLGKQHEKNGEILYELHADFKGSLDQLLIFFDTVKSSKQWIDLAGCTLNRLDANLFCMRGAFNFHYF